MEKISKDLTPQGVVMLLEILNKVAEGCRIKPDYSLVGAAEKKPMLTYDKSMVDNEEEFIKTFIETGIAGLNAKGRGIQNAAFIYGVNNSSQLLEVTEQKMIELIKLI